MAPKTIPAILPADRILFAGVVNRRGASVGASPVIVLSLVINAIVVEVIVAVLEMMTVVRLVLVCIGVVLMDVQQDEFIVLVVG
jgi:hypothetical protein